MLLINKKTKNVFNSGIPDVKRKIKMRVVKICEVFNSNKIIFRFNISEKTPANGVIITRGRKLINEANDK